MNKEKHRKFWSAAKPVIMSCMFALVPVAALTPITDNKLIYLLTYLGFVSATLLIHYYLDWLEKDD